MERRSPERIASRSKNARARPAAVDPHAPNGGDRHGWIFGEPGVVAQGKNLSVQRCAGSKSLPNQRKERKMIVKMA
jgi:hypothetical protein